MLALEGSETYELSEPELQAEIDGFDCLIDVDKIFKLQLHLAILFDRGFVKYTEGKQKAEYDFDARKCSDPMGMRLTSSGYEYIKLLHT